MTGGNYILAMVMILKSGEPAIYPLYFYGNPQWAYYECNIDRDGIGDEYREILDKFSIKLICTQEREL